MSKWRKSASGSRIADVDRAADVADRKSLDEAVFPDQMVRDALMRKTTFSPGSGGSFTIHGVKNVGGTRRSWLYAQDQPQDVQFVDTYYKRVEPREDEPPERDDGSRGRPEVPETPAVTGTNYENYWVALHVDDGAGNPTGYVMARLATFHTDNFSGNDWIFLPPDKLGMEVSWSGIYKETSQLDPYDGEDFLPIISTQVDEERLPGVPINNSSDALAHTLVGSASRVFYGVNGSSYNASAAATDGHYYWDALSVGYQVQAWFSSPFSTSRTSDYIIIDPDSVNQIFHFETFDNQNNMPLYFSQVATISSTSVVTNEWANAILFSGTRNQGVGLLEMHQTTATTVWRYSGWKTLPDGQQTWLFGPGAYSEVSGDCFWDTYFITSLISYSYYKSKEEHGYVTIRRTNSTLQLEFGDNYMSEHGDEREWRWYQYDWETYTGNKGRTSGWVEPTPAIFGGRYPLPAYRVSPPTPWGSSSRWIAPRDSALHPFGIVVYPLPYYPCVYRNIGLNTAVATVDGQEYILDTRIYDKPTQRTRRETDVADEDVNPIYDGNIKPGGGSSRGAMYVGGLSVSPHRCLLPGGSLYFKMTRSDGTIETMFFCSSRNYSNYDSRAENGAFDTYRGGLPAEKPSSVGLDRVVFAFISSIDGMKKIEVGRGTQVPSYDGHYFNGFFTIMYSIDT